MDEVYFSLQKTAVKNANTKIKSGRIELQNGGQLCQTIFLLRKHKQNNNMLNGGEVIFTCEDKSLNFYENVPWLRASLNFH